MRKTSRRLFVGVVVALSAAAAARADTVISYQGKVTTASGPVSGTCDIRFRLYEGPEGGDPVGDSTCLNDVTVTDGIFSVNLDFGNEFIGSPRFIEIDVRPNSPRPCSDSSGFETLSPRQQVIAAPYARYSETTRGITVAPDGSVGIGTGSPVHALHVVGASGDSQHVGRGVQFIAGDGLFGSIGATFNIGGGTNPGPTTIGNGGTATLSAGQGAIGVPGGAGGDIVLNAGRGGFSSSAVSAGAGGNIYLRPGVSGWSPDPSLGVNGAAVVQGPLVVDQDGPSVLNIGARGSSTGGRTVMLLGTSAASGGHCYIQGVSSAGSDFGQLVLNPGGGSVAKPGGGSFSNYSDARLKTDIQPLTGTLDKLLKLRGYTYRYTDEARSTLPILAGEQVGLIAQEVQRVFPDWVDTDRDGLLMVTERSTTALMVESLRDLRAEKDRQLAERDTRLQMLERENADLKQRLERLERALSK